MAAMAEMLKRRPMRKTQSLEPGQSFNFSCPSPNSSDKNRNQQGFEGAGSPGLKPGLKRKTKSIECKEKRGMEAAKVKAMEDHNDMLFVTAVECVDLAPFVKVSKSIFSSDRNTKEVQVEGTMHLAFQLSSAVRRSDDICVAGMTHVYNVGGTGRIDEEYVFDIPGGTVALQVSCLMRKYTGKRKYHQETLIGHCSIPLDRLPESGHVEQWYSFKHPTDETIKMKAAVKLKLKLVVSTSTTEAPNQESVAVSAAVVEPELEPEPVAHTHAHLSNPLQHNHDHEMKGLMGNRLDESGPTISDRTLSTNSIEEEEEWWRRQVVTSGLVDFIAIIRGGANVTGSDGVSRPEACVTERWPAGDTADKAEFPQKAEWFCFPGGWQPVQGKVKRGVIEKDSPKTEKPMPRIDTFGVQLGGARAWGVCLIDHELSVDGWWWPVGTLLLTRLPIIEALKLWLSEFYYFLGRQQAGNNQLLSSVLAPFFMQLLVTVPRPVDNVLAIRFDPFGTDSRRIVVDVAAPHGLPPFGFNLHASIACLGPGAIVQLLGHALGERKLLLHSSDMSTVTPLAEALCCLLYPLQWSHAYIPVLPKVMLEILEAPQPYIVGIHTDWLNEVHGSSLEDVVIVDIDRGSVETFEDSFMGKMYKLEEAKEASRRGWGFDNSSSSPAQPHALPDAVEANLKLLISDYLIQGDLPLDDANAPLFAPSSSESELRVADMLSQGAVATPLQLSVRSDSAASVQLRLAFAAQFAVMLAGFEQCIYWVDAGYPVFDEKRFLDDFNSPKETDAISQLINTQMFQQLLESFDDPELASFHSLVHHVDIDAKRVKGSGKAGLAAARHNLTRPSLDPAAPSSRVAAIARAARFKVPQPGSGGCCRYTLVVPYMKLDEHKRARSRWSSVSGAILTKHHSAASGGKHRSIGFPSESLISVSIMDDAVTSLAERSKVAFESARDSEEYAETKELPQETIETEGGGRFRWKAAPPPLPEDATVWTVGGVADSSGAPVYQLIQPPVAELDFDHDLLIGADETSTGMLMTNRIATLTRSVSDNYEDGENNVSSPKMKFNKSNSMNSDMNSQKMKIPIKEPISCRAAQSIYQGGDAFDNYDAGPTLSSKPRTPSKHQRRGSTMVMSTHSERSDGNKSDEDEINENLTSDEQQLTRCVAIALSTPDGPPKALLDECVSTIGRLPELSQRLVKILTRMRKHAARRKVPPKDAGSAQAAAAAAAAAGGISGYRLPCAGFETLATLCHATLKSCGLRKDYDPPYTLLRLTGAYYQKVKDPNDIDDDELEYLSSRLSENPIYSDLGLWNFVLSKDLKFSQTEEEISVADKRAVVQRVTLLLYSMRGIGMTPHRAVMLVRSVVSKYSLSQRQWRQLHGVVCTVWKDASLPAFNKLGFVSTTTTIDEEDIDKVPLSPNPVREAVNQGLVVETKTTPVAPRKLLLDVDEKSWQYDDDEDAIGNCNFFLGGGGGSGKRRKSITPDMMSYNEEVKDENEKKERLSVGDAVLPMTTSESKGTMTCLSIWGDKAVFGGTDNTVKCLQLPYSGRLKRDESMGGFAVPNLEVMATHPAPVTCVSLLDPYIISGDSSGVVKFCFPFDNAHPMPPSPAKGGIFSPTPRTPVRNNIATLIGHDSAITCIGVPRLAGGANGPTENLPPPGLTVPLVATGSMDGVVRIWNLSVAKEEMHPSSWAVFEPPKKQSNGFVPFSTDKSNIVSAKAIRSLQLDSWGRCFASGANDGCVRLLDIEQESCVGQIMCHTAAVRAVRFKGGNNNRILSCSNDRTCCLTDPRAHGMDRGTGGGSAKESTSGATTMLQFLGHGAPVTCLDEGNESDPIFFTGSADCRVMVWDARTSKLPMWVWEGHEGTVMSIRSFGNVIVTAGEDGSVCEWDLKTGKLIRKHRCPAPIISAASSGGRFVTSTWAQRMHVFTFDNRRPSIIRTPVAYSPGTLPPSPHSGGRGSWNPTSSLTTPSSPNGSDRTDPWMNSPSNSMQVSIPPLDIHPPPRLGSPHDMRPPPKLGSPRDVLVREAEKEQEEERLRELERRRVLEEEASGVVVKEKSRWEKMGGSVLDILDSVTEVEDEVDKTPNAVGHNMFSERMKKPDQGHILHRKHAPIKSSLTVDIEKEGMDEDSNKPKEVIRNKPKLKPSLSPKNDESNSSEASRMNRQTKKKPSLKHVNSVPPPPPSLESSNKKKEVSIDSSEDHQQSREKMDLMETLIMTRRARSHTPGKALGLAAAQRGAVVNEPRSRIPRARSPRKKSSPRVGTDSEGTTKVMVRTRSKPSPKGANGEESTDSTVKVIRTVRVRSKDSPHAAEKGKSAEESTESTVKVVRTVRVRSKDSPRAEAGTVRNSSGRVRTRSPDNSPPRTASMVASPRVQAESVSQEQVSSAPQRPVIKRSPRHKDIPLNAASLTSLNEQGSPLVQESRSRTDSVSSDIAEMATGLEAFLRGAKLSAHLEAMHNQGISELLQLDQIEDSILIGLGMKKPEVKRMRRYLKRVMSL